MSRSIGALYKLEAIGVLGDDYAYKQEIIASDLWATMNTHILAEMNKRELDDQNHFSRMRVGLKKPKK